jgi:hypothetical protein
MRFNEAWCVTAPLLLLAVAGACVGDPALRPHGSVEIQLTAVDAAGTPQRLSGEFTFSGVDNDLVESASGERGAADVLEVQLPAGRYIMTLNEAYVVEGLPPCTQATTTVRKAWVHPERPPLVGVAEGQITRVHFDLVSAHPPRSLAGAIADPHRPRMRGSRCSIPNEPGASSALGDVDASKRRPSASFDIGRAYDVRQLLTPKQ